MTRPEASTTTNVHLHGEGDAPPTVVITTHPLHTVDGGAYHDIDVFSGNTQMATFTIFSRHDAQLLVTQVDERPQALDLVEEMAAARE